MQLTILYIDIVYMRNRLEIRVLSCMIKKLFNSLMWLFCFVFFLVDCYRLRVNIWLGELPSFFSFPLFVGVQFVINLMTIPITISRHDESYDFLVPFSYRARNLLHDMTYDMLDNTYTKIRRWWTHFSMGRNFPCSQWSILDNGLRRQ